MNKRISYSVTDSSGLEVITTDCVSKLVSFLDKQGLSTYHIVQILRDNKSDSGHVLKTEAISADKDYLPPSD